MVKGRQEGTSSCELGRKGRSSALEAIMRIRENHLRQSLGLMAPEETR